MNHEERTRLLKLAAKVSKDPLLLRKISDQVYQLMKEDLRKQQERSKKYRGLL